MRRLRPLSAVAVVTTLGLAAPAVAAQRPSPPSLLDAIRASGEDFDMRHTLGTRAPSAAQRTAAAGVSGLHVRWDPTTGLVRALSNPTGRLTAPSTASTSAIALGYLRDNAAVFGLSNADLATFRVREAIENYVFVGQVDGGRQAHGPMLTFVLDDQRRIAFVTGSYDTGVGARGEARLDAADAVRAAVRDAGATAPASLTALSSPAPGVHRFANTVAKGVSKPSDLTAEQVTFTMPGASDRLAWKTVVEVSDAKWHETVVDARTGEVLARRNAYADLGPEGTVFPGEHPDESGPRQVVPFSGVDGSWVSGTETSGNNVDAYEDRDEDDSADSGSRPAAADQHFNYGWADAYQTSNGTDVTTDRLASVTQMFYYTNVVHDFLYGLGFTEPWRNFQVDNYGRGGDDGDPVNAEARDGFGTGTEKLCKDDDNNDILCRNNANFGTQGDGTTARMQMYVWTPDNPYVDGAMDGDVIAHEYGHGLSRRLVGGGEYGSGKQVGSLGEGWSDTLSMMMWDDPIIGEYVTGDTDTGIRGVAYDTSTLEFGDFSNADGVHRNGRIWATVMWNQLDALRSRYGQAAGLTRFRQLFVDGLKATAKDPTYVDARDGFLSADDTTNGAADKCLLWVQFAERGLGEGASATQTSASPTETIPDYCLPTAVLPGAVTPEGVDVVLNAAGSTAGTHHSVGGIAGYAWDLDNDGQFDDGTGPTATFTRVGNDGASTVRVQVTNGAGATDVASATVTVTNVAPTTVVSSIASQPENSAVTVTGSVSDPGWLDALTATIDFGDGAGAQPLSGVAENDRPDSTLTYEVNHVYGDNGTFTVTVCAADDDTTDNCASQSVTITNVLPTAVIDKTAATLVGGAWTVFAHEDEVVPFAGSSTDPGSDDLTATWDWDDGGLSPDETRVHRVNPPADDPLPSPSSQPRGVLDATAHAFPEACLYNVVFGIADDDGGTASDTIVVVITGNEQYTRSAGYWGAQYRFPGQRNANDLTDARLLCYLDIVQHYSSVFSEARDASTLAAAADVLKTNGTSNPSHLLDAQLLAAWLNFANGALDPGELVDTNGDLVVDSTFLDAVTAAEAVRLNPASTSAQKLEQKNILERINLRDSALVL